MAFLTQAANRGSVSTGYEIDNSLKLEPDNSEFLSITNTSEGSKRTATYSFWLKRTELDASSYMQVAGLFNSGETVRFMFYQDHIMLENGWGGTRKRLTTNAVYRDTSAFYHFVVGIDTTQSTAANRVKLYVNGVQETSFSTEEYPDQNFDLAIGRSGANYPWRYGAYDATYYKIAGYLAEAHYIDGTQYAASDFGEFDDNGIWIPIEFTGNYGTQGSYLNFSDASNLGANPKGSDIDAVLNNITSADQATDTPTNNFCTLNPLNRNSASSGVTNNSIFTEGNTKITGNLLSYWQSGVANIGITSGKWYFEAKPYDSNTKICTIGYGDEADIENWGRNNDFPGAAGSKSYGYTGGTTAGYGQISPSTNLPNPAVTYNQTNIIGVAIDADNGYVYWSKDGTYINSGDPTSGSSGTGGIAVPTGAGTNGTLLPAVGFYYDSTVPIMLLNFGGYTTISISSAATDANGYGTFEYAPPSGYYALCTKNLAEYG